ncbi:MAG: hypothetical protein KDA44_08705 [Planctomycetales bacterium]|nr:hypothetical protein [Planctomycetales bacterium]
MPFPSRPTVQLRRAALVTGLLVLAALPARAARVDGRLKLTVVDQATGTPLAVRLELRDARDRLVRLRPEGAVVAADGVYFTGETTLELRRGKYSLLLEAGPEYQTFFTQPQSLEIARGADDGKEIAMVRRVDMRREGWFAGDLDVRLPAEGLATVMAARGVDVAPVTAVVNDRGRCQRVKSAEGAAGLLAALDERRGGGLLVIGGDPPFDPCQWNADDSTVAALTAARETGALTVARQATAWDLPLWVASGRLDAIEIMHPTPKQRSGANQPGMTRPVDRTFFPGKQGPGRYAESVYHQLLECGLRIAPAAGSAAGESDEPLGANRVYVYCGDVFTPETWLAGLRAGQVSVTNGPLLRTTVAGEPPGHVFSLERGEQRSFQIGLNLAFYAQTHIEYLEIIKNGQVLHTVRLDELAQAAGRLPEVPFDGSGWFLVRAVTDDDQQYQYATSGAYFVEQDYQRRVSRQAVEYFRVWLDELASEFADQPAVQADVTAARPFWDDLLKRATAE